MAKTQKVAFTFDERSAVSIQTAIAQGHLKEATCIRCGCSDSAACEMGCSWIWVDRLVGRGLCSACEIDGI